MAGNDTLSGDKRKEFDQCYKKKKNREQLPVCPRCQTKANVIPAVCGRPTHELTLYAAEGNVKLSGCTECCTECSQGWCKKCEEFF